MVILKVQVGDGIAFKPENNPPVACYRDAVFAFPVTFERMKLPARHSRHLREIVGKLQGGQDCLDLPDRVRGHAARVVIFVKAFEVFVPELPDNHDGLYGITVRTSRAGWHVVMEAAFKFSVVLSLEASSNHLLT